MMQHRLHLAIGAFRQHIKEIGKKVVGVICLFPDRHRQANWLAVVVLTISNEAYLKNVGRISLSGVQPKASLVLDSEGHLVKPVEGERGTYILKPAPSSYALLDRKYCPANEHLTMQLASQVYHIETAANGICFFQDGEAAYLCRRFDVGPDGQKYSQEDFASLAGLTNANGGSDYKYCNLSYEECADIIRKYVKAAPVEILKFFRIVVFNYLTLNDDAHLKNFSLINRGDGEYHLTPAYDLLSAALTYLRMMSAQRRHATIRYKKCWP